MRLSTTEKLLPSNEILVKDGGKPLHWPATNTKETLAIILQKSDELYEKQRKNQIVPNQLSLLAIHYE